MPGLSKIRTLSSTKRKRKLELELDGRPWSDLTPLLLERIRYLLDSDLYDLRLRSVCSNWRRSLANPRNRTYSLPIPLPQLPNVSTYPGASHYRHPPVLNSSRVYQISPADDPSNAWLVRSLDATPNTFTLLSIFAPTRVRCRPRLRNSLDLLQFRISEVSRCYDIENVYHHRIRKLLFLPHFVDNVDFTLFLVFVSGDMYYLNHGDSVWSPVNGVKHYVFEDLILFKGLIYATNSKGLLVSIDSAFRLTEAAPPVECLVTSTYLINVVLVAFKSDLVLVSQLSAADAYTDGPRQVHVYRWTSGGWCITRDLGDDDTVLLASEDVSTSICARDLVGCKGNCVYFFLGGCKFPYEDDGAQTIHIEDYNVYDMDEDRLYTKAMKRRRVPMIWPPPAWMRPPPKSKRRLQQLQRDNSYTSKI